MKNANLSGQFALLTRAGAKFLSHWIKTVLSIFCSVIYVLHIYLWSVTAQISTPQMSIISAKQHSGHYMGGKGLSSMLRAALALLFIHERTLGLRGTWQKAMLLPAAACSPKAPRNPALTHLRASPLIAIFLPPDASAGKAPAQLPHSASIRDATAGKANAGKAPAQLPHSASIPDVTAGKSNAGKAPAQCRKALPVRLPGTRCPGLIANGPAGSWPRRCYVLWAHGAQGCPTTNDARSAALRASFLSGFSGSA